MRPTSLNQRAEIKASLTTRTGTGNAAEAARQTMNRLHSAQYESLAAQFPTSRPDNPTEAAIQLGEQRVLAALRKDYVQ